MEEVIREGNITCSCGNYFWYLTTNQFVKCSKCSMDHEAIGEILQKDPTVIDVASEEMTPAEE